MPLHLAHAKILLCIRMINPGQAPDVVRRECYQLVKFRHFYLILTQKLCLW